MIEKKGNETVDVTTVLIERFLNKTIIVLPDISSKVRRLVPYVPTSTRPKTNVQIRRIDVRKEVYAR